MSRTFRHQQRIRRQLESFTAMRLQSEGMPDAADGHVAESGGLSHSAGAPMRGTARRAFQGANNNLLNLLVGYVRWSSRSRLFVQPGNALFDKARPPLATGR